eukprot:scaffold136075_cov48-Prasinocladus_malaysianus.AAC.1
MAFFVIAKCFNKSCGAPQYTLHKRRVPKPFPPEFLTVQIKDSKIVVQLPHIAAHSKTKRYYLFGLLAPEVLESASGGGHRLPVRPPDGPRVPAVPADGVPGPGRQGLQRRGRACQPRPQPPQARDENKLGRHLPGRPMRGFLFHHLVLLLGNIINTGRIRSQNFFACSMLR